MSYAIRIREIRERVAIWLGAVLVVIATLLFLAFLQTVSTVEQELIESRPMSFSTMMEEEVETAQGEQKIQPQLKMPVLEKLDTPNLELDPIAFDLTVQPDQLVSKRFEYEDFGSITNLYGVSGFANTADMDEKPQPITQLSALFPESLILQGIYSGEISLILEIDEQGYSRVRKVITSSHPELVAPVVATYNHALYSVPKKNGVPTRMIMRVGVIFNADYGRIATILENKKLDK